MTETLRGNGQRRVSTNITDGTVTPIFPGSRNKTGRVAVQFSGNFDSGNLVLGYLTDVTDTATFTEFDASGEATYTAADGTIVSPGVGETVYAQASGSSPDIDVVAAPIAV